ncbi:MAG: zinc ribbon domain-containing protein [Anaerolineae bacterium]|nr:zinc ribbon domain-containing protein [Anaerolineae bacterium]
MSETTLKYPCPQCGAQVDFDAQHGTMLCAYCGYQSTVPVTAEAIQEYDLKEALRQMASMPREMGYGAEKRSIKCESCGAVNTVDANVISTTCAFCGSNHVVPQAQVAQVIKPESLIPFQVEQRKAVSLFRDWLGSGFFRPNAVKKIAKDANAMLQGVYLPFWTFDAFTSSRWNAEAGYYYYETEQYWTTDQKGKRVRAQRQVQKVRWEPASGVLQLPFDDVLVPATKSVERALVERIYPFETSGLVPYQPSFLAGWAAEAYNIDLASSWNTAQEIIQGRVNGACAAEVPGDTHRSLRVQTAFSNMRYKHVLFPVWIASYRYNDKVYRFFVNGQTGEVQGEAPVSWIKVALVVLLVIIVLAVIFWLLSSGDAAAAVNLYRAILGM